MSSNKNKSRKKSNNRSHDKIVYLLVPSEFKYDIVRVTAETDSFIIVDNNDMINKNSSRYKTCVFTDEYTCASKLVDVISEEMIGIKSKHAAITKQLNELQEIYEEVLNKLKEI